MGFRSRLERLLVEDMDESRPVNEMTDAQLLRILARELGMAEEELTDEVLTALIKKWRAENAI